MRMIRPEFKRQDSRGTLIQLSSKGWRQVNIQEIKQSTRTGGHYHKRKKELFYVLRGAILLNIVYMRGKNKGPEESLSFAFYPGDAFLVEPFESHSLLGLKDSMIVVLLSSEHSLKDTYNEN